MHRLLDSCIIIGVHITAMLINNNGANTCDHTIDFMGNTQISADANIAAIHLHERGILRIDQMAEDTRAFVEMDIAGSVMVQ